MVTARGEPFEEAGITHIDMEPVGDGQSTMHQIAMLRPGDAVRLNLLRDAEEFDSADS